MNKEQAARNSQRPQQRSRHDHPRRYSPQPYFESDRGMGEASRRKDVNADDENQYDDYNSGKQENYKGDGYYGSNYGSINEWNRGRDYESNAGYRDNYDRLTSGQWPEIQQAADRRGFDLREYELAQRGVHRGKGPRGWQRSDFRIEEDINDLLTDDPYIDATEIEVKVEKGDVILSGTVENRLLKRRVEDIVEQVSGIRNIENRLRSGNPTVNIKNAR